MRFEQTVAVAYLHFVERTVFFFSIASDKRNRAAFIYEVDDGAYLRFADADFRCNFFYDKRFIDCERVHCVLSKFHIGAIVRKRTVRGKEDEKYMCDVFLYGIVIHCFCL